MSVLLLWIALALSLAMALALAWWAFRRSKTNSPKPAQAPTQARMTASEADAALAGPVSVAPAPLPIEPIPPELSSLIWQREADLTPAQRNALLAALAGITHPPGPLLQLLSTDFVAWASTGELSELVMAEPLLADKLLNQVNTQLFGLRQPVTDIAQAVALLGMATMRSICVQYTLAHVFEPASAARKGVLDTLWRASTIASELGGQLGKALNLPDRGTLPTQAVLAFVGSTATASLLPPESLGEWLTLAPPQRAAHEQAQLGLSSGEIGGLLMASWNLPPALINEVRGASRLLGQPAAEADPATAPRLALSYLCAHLGERLASGQLTTLNGHDFMQEATPATHHLRRYLQQPTPHLHSYLGPQPAQRLQAALQLPKLLAAVQRVQAPLPGG